MGKGVYEQQESLVQGNLRGIYSLKNNIERLKLSTKKKTFQFMYLRYLKVSNIVQYYIYSFCSFIAGT